MNVLLHLGEPFWRAAGQREVAVSVPPGATVAEALAAAADRFPALQAELAGAEVSPAVFVGDLPAQARTPLADGARVYVVWPVSGG